MSNMSELLIEIGAARQRVETLQTDLYDALATKNALTRQVVRMTLAIQEHKDSCAPECTTTEDQMLWAVLD